MTDPRDEPPGPEVSVVIPCLNEADTLGRCIEKARKTLAESGIAGEVIVADNGSMDGSPEIARRHAARLVPVGVRGYGSALMGGIAAARAPFIVMGDADDSYDFGDIPGLVAKLREGFDLVLGCRLPSGGGRILPGAMPFLHRWVGNPLFARLARLWFGVGIHDPNCGLRAFSRSLIERLDPSCLGMEFAVEMIIKASLRREKITEVPVTLRPDGRRAHRPHLKTFRDGWRTLRFYLLYSPRWLYLIPGLSLIVAGCLGYLVAMPRLKLQGVTFDVHTLLFSSLAIIAGFQSIFFAIYTKVFAIREGWLPEDPRVSRFAQSITLEGGVLAGAASILFGLVLLGGALLQWHSAGFGNLDYSRTMRWVIPGVTLTTLGLQAIFSSFFLSILGIRRK